MPENKTLFEALVQHLDAAGLPVLIQQRAPTNDDGLGLGKAVVAAVRPVQACRACNPDPVSPWN